MSKFLLTIDQSTSGTKVLLINEKAQTIDKLTLSHQQIYPQPGWLEHNPTEIYENTVSLLNEIVTKHQLTHDSIQALSITNQRETCLFWDTSGQPIHNAIVWQCNRTAELCESYITAGKEEFISNKTGLRISPYFSATKLQWLFEHYPLHRDAYAGTMDSWLIYQLSNHTVHVTDYTNACRTLLFNIHTLKWDVELLELFGLQQLKLPEVKNSDDFFATIADKRLHAALQGVPIYGVIGDSQAALFAQGCFKAGMVKATLGTGTSVLMNIGERAITPNNGVVTTIAWKLKNQLNYAIEGILYSTGDTLAWAKDQLELYTNFEELQLILQQTPHSEGVVIVPAFHGLGAPYWTPKAKATIYGISRSTNKEHLLKACIESIALQIHDVVHVMEQLTNLDFIDIKCDGGGSRNEFIIQDIANILQKSVYVHASTDLSPLGAAYLSGLALGWWTMDELSAIDAYSVFKPNLANVEANVKIYEWQKIVHHLHTFYEHSN